MDWKKFYKFTWIKLTLFVFIVIPSVFFILIQTSKTCNSPVHPLTFPLLSILFWPFLLMLKLEQIIFTNVDWIHAKDVPFVILALLINIIYIYSIAAGVVFLCKKIKK